MLLHSDIPGYDLPAIDFVSPSKEVQESHILEEQDATIYVVVPGFEEEPNGITRHSMPPVRRRGGVNSE